MITEKDIQTRIAEVLTEAGFNVVVSEVDEGFQKPAVFVSVYPASAELMTHGMAVEQVTDSVELKYISAVETVKDCVEVTRKFKAIPRKDRQGALYPFCLHLFRRFLRKLLEIRQYSFVVFVIPSKNLRRNTGTISVRYCLKKLFLYESLGIQDR